MRHKNKRQMLTSGIATGVVFLILVTPIMSLGWGAGGHMMTASIAFRRLNPRAKAQANELLAIAINPADVSAKSTNFINASHWADDLRPFPEFDSFKPHHFITRFFSIDGTSLPTHLSDPNNIVKALEDNVNILKTSTDKNAQAQALRFIIHFVGDIHQPLHCTTRVSRALPEGDQGGNLLSVKIPGNDGKLRTVKLHSYWDGGIDSFPKTGPEFAPPPLRQIGPAAAKATAGNPATDPRLKLDNPFDFAGWSDESFALGKDVAHKGIRAGAKPPAGYKTKALKVARQRVAWGGYRLAALLNSIWPN